MIQIYNSPVNTQVLITTIIAGTSIPGDLLLLKDGVVNGTAVAYASISGNICTFSFTPTTTGVYTLIGVGEVIATVEVVTKSIQAYLKNLEDEALGSWQWNKQTGVMTMLRQDGTQLAQFNVVDNLTTSSRERV
jgi:hypothetical protein